MLEKFWDTKIGGLIVMIVGIALVVFYFWLLFIPNQICNGAACYKEIDLGGRGGNPQKSYEENY